jgi:DNA gyrase subunit A
MNDETTPETTGSEAEAIIPQVGVVGRVVPVAIDRELSTSYLRYSMSVIVARALPDVRDGLKPVHRRVLFAMDELSLNHDKPYKKSARIVGDVIGKYHPHGDVAVYDSLVRMAQDFSLRYMLVMGQGNFGSVDGDSPAAMRYTEARMRRAAELMLQDLDRDTVDFVNNYDESLKEPAVLPSAIPNLLVNGATGIAVGMATNMPPHNLREIVAACKAVLDNPEIAIEELLQYVKGPDFPTGAIIYGRNGARDAMLTGRGRVVVRAKHHFEEIGTRQAIIFTEIPYMVNKAKLLEKIAELVRDKSIEGIADLRDESDRDGMRIVVECKPRRPSGHPPEPPVQEDPAPGSVPRDQPGVGGRPAQGPQPQAAHPLLPGTPPGSDRSAAPNTTSRRLASAPTSWRATSRRWIIWTK